MTPTDISNLKKGDPVSYNGNTYIIREIRGHEIAVDLTESTEEQQGLTFIHIKYLEHENRM